MTVTKSDNFVTREECGEVSQRVLEKLDSIERRLFKDNGTVSIQTRIERHDQILRVLVWATSIVVGTGLTSGVLGLIFLSKSALTQGVSP